MLRCASFRGASYAMVLFLMAPAGSFADENIDLKVSNELEWLQVEGMVFTASKSVEKISKSPATINVITAKQIEQMGAQDIMDVLRIIPGVGIERNRLWARTVEVRGIKTDFSEKVVFMINGHNINNQLVNGGPTLVYDRLPVENIERIEVVRGPASSLYGANAFLAIVNIMTKKADPDHPADISVQTGSYGTQQYNALIGRNFGDLSLTMNANAQTSNGYNPWVAKDALAGPASLAPAAADMKRTSYDLELAMDYRAFTFQSKLTKRKDGSNYGAIDVLNKLSVPRYQAWFLELGHHHDFSDTLSVKSRFYHDSSSYDNFWQLYPPGAPAPAFTNGMILNAGANSSIDGAELSVQWDTLKNNRIIAGVNVEQQKQYRLRHITNYNPLTYAPLPGLTDFSATLNWGRPATRRLWSAYIEDIWDVASTLRLVSSVRYDRYNDFGHAVNPKVGATWELAQGYDVRLMYGSAYRAPTFAETYNVNNPVINGNPAIKPEKVRTLELGLKARLSDKLNANFTLFHNKIRNTISPAAGLYRNTNAIKTQGLELGGKFEFARGSYMEANYSYVAAKNETNRMYLPDIAKNRGNIMLNWKLSGHFNIYADAHMQGSSPRAAGDPRARLGGYTVMNTSVIAKRLLSSLPGLELRASAYNVLNRAYASPAPINTIPGDYAMPKLNFMIEARHKL